MPLFDYATAMMLAYLLRHCWPLLLRHAFAAIISFDFHYYYAPLYDLRATPLFHYYFLRLPPFH
jgi:hypothetical protein